MFSFFLCPLFSYGLIDLEALSDSIRGCFLCLFFVLTRLFYRWWCLVLAGGTHFLIILFSACWQSSIIMPGCVNSLRAANGAVLLHLLYRRLPHRETSLINYLFMWSYSSFRESRINAWFLLFTGFQIMYCFLINSWIQISLFSITFLKWTTWNL